jgi:L-alanine-DL-glutamate epimerase-like enolase superfamily enzyme
MACWDLIGRAAGQPLCHLLGGAYRRRIPLAAQLVGERIDHVLHLSRELAELGFHCQIVSSRGRPDDDLAMLAAISDGSAERTELRFDAAAHYDLETARDLCTELEPSGLQFVLDPLATNELHQVASLGRQTTVPLAVGRAIGSPADVLAAVRSHAAEFLVVKPAQVGGITPARHCAAVADAAGVNAVLGSGPSLGVATAAMLQLAASTPAFSGCNESIYHELRDDVLREPLEVADGMMPVPQAPGLGIQVDRAKIDRYQVT